METEVIPNRVYEHFKGGRYYVLSVADDSTNGRKGNKLVVYVSLTYGVLKCRDLAEFTESVAWPDGITRPRFVPEGSLV
jgi:hypothetical protein